MVQISIRIAYTGDSWVDPKSWHDKGQKHWTDYVTEDGGFTLAVNSGVGGQKSWEVSQRFQTDTLSYSPDLVIILCGGNDWWTEPYGDKSDRTLGYIRSMVDKCKSAGVVPVICGYSKVDLSISWPDESQQQMWENCEQILRNKLISYCNTQNITYIDPYTDDELNLTKHPDRATSDGFHLDGDGNRKMADLVLRTITSAVQEVEKKNSNTNDKKDDNKSSTMKDASGNYVFDTNKVHHVISAGLVKGRYYRVYVTQVNKAGLESERSAPALIRVGDVYAPPVPYLSLDTSFYENGCCARDNFIDVYFKWTESVCDDLANYIGYLWQENAFTNYKGDGIYAPSELPPTQAVGTYPSGSLSTIVTGQQPGTYIYAGIQAVDLSHNYSDVHVIRVRVEDTTVIGKPTEPIHAEAHGIWAIRVWTKCPHLTYIKHIIIYRDGDPEAPIATLLFHAGLDVEFVDTLDVMNGLTHYYTYRYVTFDGRESPMSDPSETVEAKPIDLTYINQAELEALKDLWNTENVESIAELRRQAEASAKEAIRLATELQSVKEDYNKMYNDFTLAANNIKLLSAKVEKDENKITAMNTAIEQNGKAISLRATKSDIDSVTNQLNNQIRSQLKVQGDKITSTVASLSNINSQIVQLNNAISLKVSQGDINARIAAAVQNGISTAYIKADRIVLTGQMLLQGNARISGKLYSNELGLVDSSTGQVVWGSGTGTLKPATYDRTLIGNEWKAVCTQLRTYSGNADPIPMSFYHFDYNPIPPFRGSPYCQVSVTLTFTPAVMGNETYGSWNFGSEYFWLAISSDQSHVPTSLDTVVKITGNAQGNKGDWGTNSDGNALSNQPLTVDGWTGNRVWAWNQKTVKIVRQCVSGQNIRIYFGRGKPYKYTVTSNVKGSDSRGNSRGTTKITQEVTPTFNLGNEYYYANKAVGSSYKNNWIYMSNVSVHCECI